METIEEVQKRVDALSAAMLGKALREPSARFSVEANVEPLVTLSWNSKSRSYPDKHEFFRGSLEEAFAAASAFIAGIPTPEQARMKAFMESLGETIELGKKTDVDVEEFVNPLVLLMQQLSKNALTGPVSA